jgi:hypothetical protein
MEDNKINPYGDYFEHAAWVVRPVTYSYLQFNTHNSQAKNKPQKIHKFSTHTEHVHLHEARSICTMTNLLERERERERERTMDKSLVT